MKSLFRAVSACLCIVLLTGCDAIFPPVLTPTPYPTASPTPTAAPAADPTPSPTPSPMSESALRAFPADLFSAALRVSAAGRLEFLADIENMSKQAITEIRLLLRVHRGVPIGGEDAPGLYNPDFSVDAEDLPDGAARPTVNPAAVRVAGESELLGRMARERVEPGEMLSAAYYWDIGDAADIVLVDYALSSVTLADGSEHTIPDAQLQWQSLPVSDARRLDVAEIPGGQP